MSFLLFKTLHVSCAALSFTLFSLRGIWSFNDSPIMRQRWVEVVPHVVDTLLLANALALAFTIEQYPFVDTWLTAKVFGLILYIMLGSVALTPGRSRIIRISAWLAALTVFIYIVLVAATHNPLLFIRTTT